MKRTKGWRINIGVLCIGYGCLFLLMFKPAFTQQKYVSCKAAFGTAPADLAKPLPEVVGWSDNETVLVSRSGNKPGVPTTAINVRTGASHPDVLPKKTGIGIPGKTVPAAAEEYYLSPDGKFAAYTYRNDLYTVNTSSGKVTRVTTDGSSVVRSGSSAWLYYEEVLGRNSRAFWWSNDSKCLVFMHFDESAVSAVSIDAPAAGNKIARTAQRFPYAGGKNPAVKIGIFNVQKAQLLWADFNENEEQYFRQPYFTPENNIWIQWVNRRQDTWKIFEVSPSDGSKKEIYTETQKTWITQQEGIYFVPGGKQYIIRSDKSGWSHFYLFDRSGRLIRPLTSGKFNVERIVKMEAATNSILFTAMKENSAKRDLYSVDLQGEDLKRITTGPYSYDDITISPGNTFFTAVYSNLNKPSTLGVFDRNGKMIRELGSVAGPAYKHYFIPRMELKRVKSKDGLFDLPFTIIYPDNFDKNKRYPVIMNVYGGPYSMNVKEEWSLSPAEIWWAQEGIIQVRADNRSSGHFGKAGMNGSYKKFGIAEIGDFMAVGEWLKEQSWVEPSKLCLNGASFGGYMTCLGLTYGAAVFNYGTASWPVTDWRLYDTYYTEKYMGTPDRNKEGYDITAVKNYVGRYKGVLRIAHGTADDNAHIRNSIELIHAFEKANKKIIYTFYKGQKHGLRGAAWRQNKLETSRFYYQYLLGKEMPSCFGE